MDRVSWEMKLIELTRAELDAEADAELLQGFLGENNLVEPQEVPNISENEEVDLELSTQLQRAFSSHVAEEISQGMASGIEYRQQMSDVQVSNWLFDSWHEALDEDGDFADITQNIPSWPEWADVVQDQLIYAGKGPGGGGVKAKGNGGGKHVSDLQYGHMERKILQKGLVIPSWITKKFGGTTAYEIVLDLWSTYMHHAGDRSQEVQRREAQLFGNAVISYLRDIPQKQWRSVLQKVNVVQDSTGVYLGIVASHSNSEAERAPNGHRKNSSDFSEHSGPRAPSKYGPTLTKYGSPDTRYVSKDQIRARAATPMRFDGFANNG